MTKFYTYHLLSQAFNQQVLMTVSGQQLPRTSWNNMREIKIPVPPLPQQTQLVAEIEEIEARILAAKQVIAQAVAQKQAVMKRYL